MIELEACMATQSWVNMEYRRGLRTHPCGDQRGGDVVSYLHHIGAAHQKVQNPVAQGGSRPSVSGLMASLEDTMVLKAEL